VAAAEADVLAGEGLVVEVDAPGQRTLAFIHVTSVAPDPRFAAFRSTDPVRQVVALVRPAPLRSVVRLPRQIPASVETDSVEALRLEQTPGRARRHVGVVAAATAEEDVLTAEALVDEVGPVGQSTLAFRHVTSVAPDAAFASTDPVRHVVAPVRPAPPSP
jgi:hypothetical protein